jgi:uncharacterized membrane protein YqjE
MADPQGGGGAGPAAILYTRLDLATVELQDQGIRVVKLLLAGFLAVVLLITAFFFFNFWIIAAFWSTPYRLVAIGVIFAIYFFGGVIAASAARSFALSWPGFLSQTIKELRRDVEGLQDLIARDKEEKK